MRDLHKALQSLKFDIRMTDWNFNNDILKKNEWDQHLKQLPDLSSQAVSVDLTDRAEDDDIDNEHLNGGSHN